MSLKPPPVSIAVLPAIVQFVSVVLARDASYKAPPDVAAFPANAQLVNTGDDCRMKTAPPHVPLATVAVFPVNVHMDRVGVDMPWMVMAPPCTWTGSAWTCPGW